MVSMEMVVERGQARCPRCVAVADYFFVELAPNLMRYEVNCRRCGEDYREEHGPVPPAFGVLVQTDDLLVAPKVPVRQRVRSLADIVVAWAAALLNKAVPQ